MLLEDKVELRICICGRSCTCTCAYVAMFKNGDQLLYIARGQPTRPFRHHARQTPGTFTSIDQVTTNYPNALLSLTNPLIICKVPWHNKHDDKVKRPIKLKL